eukprot:6204915-Pleurochrysis_carterae.AAC.1
MARPAEADDWSASDTSTRSSNRPELLHRARYDARVAGDSMLRRRQSKRCSGWRCSGWSARTQRAIAGRMRGRRLRVGNCWKDKRRRNRQRRVKRVCGMQAVENGFSMVT